MKYITLLLIGLVILLCFSGINEHFIDSDYLINNKNKNCPFPWNKYQTFTVNNKCKIRKSYLLLDAPEECCKDLSYFGKVESDCSKEDEKMGLCGSCELDSGTYKMEGNIYYPYQKFNTYCRPYVRYNWEMKRAIADF